MCLLSNPQNEYYIYCLTPVQEKNMCNSWSYNAGMSFSAVLTILVSIFNLQKLSWRLPLGKGANDVQEMKYSRAKINNMQNNDMLLNPHNIY